MVEEITAVSYFCFQKKINGVQNESMRFPKWYWPHDHDDKFHHNLIEDVEELNHEPGLFTHLPHADAKCNKETNQTCGRKWKAYFGSGLGPARSPHIDESFYIYSQTHLVWPHVENPVNVLLSANIPFEPCKCSLADDNASPISLIYSKN